MPTHDENESETRDLGELDGPVLVFGGPNGNLEATAALIQAARRLGVPAARAICTGDVVAYAADPQATVDLVREWGCAVLMGNCEEALAADAGDCGCAFNEGSTCATLSVQWFDASRRDLGAEAKRWMGTLPRRIVFTLGGRTLAAIHGGVRQINRWIFASTPEAEKAAEIDATGADGVVAGHSGIPFTQFVGDRLWHNSGAVGMPANDGTPRVWFSLLVPTRNGIAVAHHALDYDFRTAAAKMRARAYPVEYADCLVSGLWPSCDILPPAECAERGQALVARDLVWPRAKALSRTE
jgi:predicted phosphodiesterase